MSSNHTYVSKREWEAMQTRIRQTESYVINRRQETERIERLAAQRRNEISVIHNANQRTIQNAVEAMRTSYSEAVGRLTGQVNTQIRAQTDNFNNQFDSIRAELSSVSTRITAMNRRVDSIANIYNSAFQGIIAQEQQSAERANIFARELANLLNQIETLEPQRFTPNEYTALVSLRNSLIANINAGDHQSAIMVAQSGILDASRLLARLIIINEQFNDTLQSARVVANEIQDRIERLSSPDGILQIEINEENHEFDYDISFWSYGRFDALVSEFNRLESIMNNRSLTIEQLSEVTTVMRRLDDNLTECDLQARRERAGAIATTDTAVRLHNGLTSAGWNLNDSGYSNGDERNPYAMTYEDNAGNTISVVVAPESPEKPSFFIEVFSDDEDLASMTKEGVHALLEEEGITIDGVERRNDCHLNPDAETFIQNATEEALTELERRRPHTQL